MDTLFSAPSATWLRLRRPPSTRPDARFLDEVLRDLRWGPRAGAHLTLDWKQQLHDACREATPRPAPPGGVAVRLRLGVSRQRNWSALWKPALDALGPVLGVPDPTRPYLAADDRVTRLELHRRLDETVGHRVDVELWWAPAG